MPERRFSEISAAIPKEPHIFLKITGKKMAPRVSVILPSYNSEEYIHAAINSILCQTLTNIELIVVDDGSSDRTVQVARSFSDPRLVVIAEKSNAGYPTAMKIGLRHARGEFIARMDADDISLPTRLERQVELFQQNKLLVLVGTIADRITPKEYILPASNELRSTTITENWSSVFHGTRKFVDPSVMLRLEDLVRVGGYRTYRRTGQDVDLWLRLLEMRNYAATINESLYARRLRSSMITLDANTYGNNLLPRIFSEQRMRLGSDPVMRGEDFSHLIPQGTLAESHKHSIRLIWGVAAMCFEAGDHISSWRFASQALRSGKASAATLRGIRIYMRAVFKAIVNRRNGIRLLERLSV